MRKLKVGIDVGGTFTHAVAVEVTQRELVGKACVPTTHKAKAGVAQGVIDSLQVLLKENQIAADEILLIAHSTTQATNALLEGDVAPVGVIAMGTGLEGWRAKSETRFDQLELAPGKLLPVSHCFLDTGKALTADRIREALKTLKSQGAEVIVASEVFGVDHPENELQVVEIAEEMGLLATAASQISKLYGLKVRTRTAVINASMMPKMLETANLTEQAIREAGITTPVMVMRSDGGIMSIDQMRQRPILTMLSGPAAGVAAALMYARVSDGIFIEVGGTSSDITVIRNGKPQVKSAQIGGHRLYVQTLDVRTLGIAGGSIPRVKGKEVVDVGPRSAHIADLAYPSFVNESQSDFSQATISQIQPRDGDPKDYLKLSLGEQGYTITPTEASHYLDLGGDSGHGAANRAALKSAIEHTAKQMGISGEAFATALLTRAAEKIKPTIKQLLREYKLDSDLISFVGGGGGAPAIVPFSAKYLCFKYRMVEHGEVISAIGAALGLIRDSVERNLLNPSNEDLIQLRHEAYEAVLAMGAAPDSIDVSVEVDTRNKKVIAVATGASELKSEGQSQQALSESDLKQSAADALKSSPEQIELLGQTEQLFAYGLHTTHRILMGLIKRDQLNIRVLDSQGVVKLQLNNALYEATEVNQIKKQLPKLIEHLTSYGDAGGLIPDVYVLLGRRILDLSGLVEVSQMVALLEQDLQQQRGEQPAVLLAMSKGI